MDPMSILEDTERTRFCPQTDKVIPVYPLSTSLKRGYKNTCVKLLPYLPGANELSRSGTIRPKPLWPFFTQLFNLPEQSVSLYGTRQTPDIPQSWSHRTNQPTAAGDSVWRNWGSLQGWKSNQSVIMVCVVKHLIPQEEFDDIFFIIVFIYCLTVQKNYQTAYFNYWQVDLIYEHPIFQWLAVAW